MNLLAILFLGTAHGFGSAPSTDRMEGTFTLEDGSLLPYEAEVPHVAGGAPLLLYVSPSCRPLSFWTGFLAGGAAHAVALGWAFAMVEMPQYGYLPGEPTPGWFCQDHGNLVRNGTLAANDTSWFNQSAACVPIESRADQLFSGEASPLAVLCRSPTIDCSKGVGIVGNSLGGSIAKQAPRMDTRVTATLITSVPNDVCSPSALPPSKVLALIGADEEFYAGVTGLQGVSGAPQSTCGTSTRCIAADGSGYNVIEGVEQFPGASKHETFILRFWLGGDEEWHYAPALEWLMGAAARV